RQCNRARCLALPQQALEWEDAMLCDSCQGETQSRRVTKSHPFKGRLYVVENVPAEVCPECGQRYYHATTLDAVDRLLESDHPVKETLQVEVVIMQPKSAPLA